MKNFQFDFIYDLFDDNMFGKKGGIFEFMANPGNAFEGRHNLKLMYLRKKAFNMAFKKETYEDKENKDELPRYIYGPGKGLDSTHHIQFWNETNDEEWTTDDDVHDNEKNEEEDEEEEIEIEDDYVLDGFIEENSIEKSKNNFICRYCGETDPKLTFTSKKLKTHFIENHRKEFEEYFGPDGN
jgi:hypothetical protein